MDDQDYPSDRLIWRELTSFMRAVEGHTNRSGKTFEGMWSIEKQQDWPTKTVFAVSDRDKWSKGTTLKGSKKKASSNPGKTLCVSGLKYSNRGGFCKNMVGPGIEPKAAQALTEAANHSLATSTWTSYSSVWKQVSKLASELGISFRLPMTTPMVRGIVGLLIRKKRKAGTIQTYMSSLKKAHEVRGLDSSALQDWIVQAALKGVRNRESLCPTPRPVITMEKLKSLRIAIKAMKGPSTKKKVVWAAAIWLFMGSMRGSEILAPTKARFDPNKTMLQGDVKEMVVKMGEERVTTLQLTLKNPKTSRTQPVQVVELPELGGWLCPVKAYRDWQKSKKGKRMNCRPLFTWEDDTLLTLGELNAILAGLLPTEDPTITSRAFRPALPSILAREGASEDLLRSLGRWTSSTYLTYVREGRTGDWRTLLAKLRGLTL